MYTPIHSAPAWLPEDVRNFIVQVLVANNDVAAFVKACETQKQFDPDFAYAVASLFCTVFFRFFSRCVYVWRAAFFFFFFFLVML